ncbi:MULTISPECIES: threonine synthase [Chryseobacterium]|uniref:Threonine synthase n=1 Tax=Chryseobacterium camelliae TaxID=1265445 RepID=A0ABU0TK90_9FLAO|nr:MULTISPECIES: threonine synthase [Chryseobacterium]MDT3408687.1 threonine synthase [Pseudacidovorax intermedius]MDQ1097459.1 threonine synthase [Chryseobacterium camelliae]MDQ1101388.1 threonine synthase [Chryseobacterium sp. SORGH_AS_1048]MDR6084832.1 threonine synthase [Chryseobacterium sp. SORGH_AS_0909]MDR6129181.1 threonine synthase [Chryseobacterium sp. SORGH_AS_1175]
MNYYNLKDKKEVVDFRTALIRSQGKEKGLFFPERIPMFDPEFIKNLDQFTDVEIGFQCMKDFTGEEIPPDILRQIITETINFEIPLKKINDQMYILELFHGPTLAFKDVGARFMSRCLSYFLNNNNKKVTVLVATSGDTGGAVANGFLKTKGIEVVILYPKNRVSDVQEKQLTALGENIYALEVNGSFDDCQSLVKQAFADEEIHAELLLTSANSINVARWLPQQIYYLLALKQWQKTEAADPVISVPSGNFGNLCAGLLAHLRGMPAKHFIAACNENDVIPHYLKTQDFKPKETVATLSNAMDVSHPSNFVRILELFDHRFENLTESISGTSVDDDKTLQTIQEVYKNYGYLLEPHSAVAYAALEEYLTENLDKKGLILGTAHPVKFSGIVERAVKTKIPLPDALENLMKKEKKSFEIAPEFKALKKFLLRGK